MHVIPSSPSPDHTCIYVHEGAALHCGNSEPPPVDPAWMRKPPSLGSLLNWESPSSSFPSLPSLPPHAAPYRRGSTIVVSVRTLASQLSRFLHPNPLPLLPSHCVSRSICGNLDFGRQPLFPPPVRLENRLLVVYQAPRTSWFQPAPSHGFGGGEVSGCRGGPNGFRMQVPQKHHGILCS